MIKYYVTKHLQIWNRIENRKLSARTAQNLNTTTITCYLRVYNVSVAITKFKLFGITKITS